MPRYRVAMHREHIYFIDASTPESAALKGIAMDAANQRPAYKLESTADVDMLAETVEAPAVHKMRLREAANHAKEELQ